MGQIAPRRSKKGRAPLHQKIKALAAEKFAQGNQNGSRMTAAAATRLRSGLHKVWHLTDNLRWLEPLPPAHRRGIILALLVILLAVLWPAPSSNYPVERPQTASHERDVAMQAELYDGNGAVPQADAQGTWHRYTVAAGQTLAQLFRDNNLPVNDLYAMTQVEGSGQPLSALQSGQQVDIRQNTQGVVTGLTLENASGAALFTRQPDGSFIRVR